MEPRTLDGVTGRELAAETYDELRGLSKETAERVARHMVSAYLLEAEDQETAQAHARFAARLGGRVGVVRECFGIIAYNAGDYRTAVRELRTAMRITGRVDLLPLLADAERGLGRPERALDIAASDDAAALSVSESIELMIVVAGAYADTGDIETALRTLETPALRHKVDGKWQVRLWVAYSDLLDRAGRSEEARRWLTLAADADTDGITDAGERLGRPASVVPADPTWEDDEQVSVLDTYDPDADAADAEVAEPDAGESVTADTDSPETNSESTETDTESTETGAETTETDRRADETSGASPTVSEPTAAEQTAPDTAAPETADADTPAVDPAEERV